MITILHAANVCDRISAEDRASVVSRSAKTLSLRNLDSSLALKRKIGRTLVKWSPATRYQKDLLIDSTGLRDPTEMVAMAESL
jgi:hypothetical protein